MECSGSSRGVIFENIDIYLQYLFVLYQNVTSFFMEDLFDLHEPFETLILSTASVIELVGLAFNVILKLLVTLFNETFAKNQELPFSWSKETFAFFPSEGQATISKEVAALSLPSFENIEMSTIIVLKIFGHNLMYIDILGSIKSKILPFLSDTVRLRRG